MAAELNDAKRELLKRLEKMEDIPVLKKIED